MRTDVKIGIAVGLAFALAVVVWFVLNSGGDDPNGEELAGVENPQPNTPEPQPQRDPLGDPPRAGAEEPRVPRVEPVTPRVEPVTPRVEPVTPRVEPVTPRVEPVTPRVEPVTPRVEPVTPRVEPVTPRVDPITPRVDPITPRVDPIGPRVDPVTPRATPGETTEYTVQSGDAGFWGVAEKVYGPGGGRYMDQIAKANPDVDPRRLRVGQTLKIPPRPVARGSNGGTTVATEASEGQIVSENGRKYYVIKSGDNGFWSVARAAWGADGAKHWPAIAKANPDLNAYALRPGQKVLIPDKPQSAERTGGGTPTPTVTQADGSKIITVQPGDAGFWGIAQREYGNGVFFPVIADANPDADPRRLRVGQKLLLPALSAEMRRHYLRGRSSGSGTSGSSSGSTGGGETTGGSDASYPRPQFD